MKKAKVKPYRVTIRLGTDEYELLKERAQKSSKALSTYIRKTSLGKQLHERPQEEFIMALVNLSKIGNNLNQIAIRVNTYKYLDEKQLENVISQLNLFIKDCRKKYIGSG